MKVTHKISAYYAEEYLMVHHNQFYHKLLSKIKTAKRSDLEAGIHIAFSNHKNSSDSKLMIGPNEALKRRVLVQVHANLSLDYWQRILFRRYIQYEQSTNNVSIEIVITSKKMQSEMSSGGACYEGEVYNVLRRAKGNPPVPLLILGIEP